MEQVILVDKNDQQIGVMEKEEAHKNGGHLHRAISVMLYRSPTSLKLRGGTEVLLQKRALTKRRWPGFWANTVCTDVRLGETYEQCAVRRLREEMGIEIDEKDLSLAFTQIYKAKYDEEYTEHEVEAVFVAPLRQGYGGARAVKPNPEEVAECRWVSFGEIEQLKNLAPWLVKMIDDKRLELAFRGVRLDHVGKFSFDPVMLKNKNIENLVGATQVPLGVAGPLRTKLKIDNGKWKINDYWVPMATTEGALVASVNRGCKAIWEAGGCTAEVEKVGVTRGPVFKVAGIVQGKKLEHWLDENENLVKKVAEKTSTHLRYKSFSVQMAGRNVWVRFSFDTGEAMGMNMVTKATQAITGLIEKKLGIECIALSGNACVDKKPSWMNFINGRGRRVWAEVVLPAEVVVGVLKTTARKVVEVVQRKQMLGSLMTGSLGFNGHFANMVAALFLATGQDLGHVAECSSGVVTAEVEGDGGLYFSIYMPDVMVGVVGGGTGLPTQKEALQLLGVDTADCLAEVVGATVLAGELSLTAALSAGQLAQAHERLGRGK